MPTELKDVKTVDPSTTDEALKLTKTDGTPEPSPGNDDVKPEDMEFEGRKVSEVFAENKRKAEDNTTLKEQNEKLLDTIHDGLASKPEPSTPERKVGELSEDIYQKLEKVGLNKEATNEISGLVVGILHDYDTKIVMPETEKLIDRANKAELKSIISADETLKPYEKEMAEGLKKLGVKEKADPEAVYNIAKQVKGAHLDEIVKGATDEARVEAKKDRKIISDSPGGATIVTEDGTQTLSQKELDIIAKVPGLTNEAYLASKIRYEARKNEEHKVGKAS